MSNHPPAYSVIINVTESKGIHGLDEKKLQYALNYIGHHRKSELIEYIRKIHVGGSVIYKGSFKKSIRHLVSFNEKDIYVIYVKDV